MADQTIDHTKLATADVASPFLPGTNIQYAVDSTSIGLMKTCPRLYQYVMIDGWEPKGESIHLRFGTEYHTTLENYDRARAAGYAHEESINDAIRNLMIRTHDWKVDTETRVGKYKNRHSILQLTIDYLDHFGKDDPAKTVILDNGKPAVELSFRFELDFGPKAAEIDVEPELLKECSYVAQPYLLCGHLDRVVEFNGQLLVVDHKTTDKSLGDYYFAQFEPNNQMTLYTVAGKIVMNTPIKGIMISAAQILLEKPNKFERRFTYRTPDQAEEWMRDLQITLNEAETYATAGYWPTRDTSCGNYGGCKFRDVCSADPAVRLNRLKADFIQKPPQSRWNPLKAR